MLTTEKQTRIKHSVMCFHFETIRVNMRKYENKLQIGLDNFPEVPIMFIIWSIE